MQGAVTSLEGTEGSEDGNWVKYTKGSEISVESQTIKGAKILNDSKSLGAVHVKIDPIT